MSLTLREAVAADEDLLWAMLAEAAHAGPDVRAQAALDPKLAAYVEGFGDSPRDVGVIALDDGAPIGAAWARGWTAERQGYIWLEDCDAPELAIAVVESARGRGVGTRLMEALFATEVAQRFGLVLSVRAENPALGLYERLGFRRRPELDTQNRAGGLSHVLTWARDPER